jgi:LAO/AO transport system kinase
MPKRDSADLQQRQELIHGILAGDFRAVARLLTLVENRPRKAVPYLRELFPHTGRSFVAGITGAPGSGKSTLIDKLVESYRTQKKRIGVIAVDPTSPFTGGAILGDRIRMQSRGFDSGTFIRSMASRGHVGGLARATADMLTVMDAAGFDIVLIETIGVGQGEVEIAKTAHATLVLLVPGMGDDVQLLKAGIMEIGDIFVINKADHEGADRTEAELRALLSMSARPDGWSPPIVRTVASEGSGIPECIQAIEKCRSFLANSNFRRDETVRIQKDRLLELACLQAREALLRDAETAARIHELALLIADRKLDPFTAAEEVIKLASDRRTSIGAFSSPHSHRLGRGK